MWTAIGVMFCEFDIFKTSIASALYDQIMNDCVFNDCVPIFRFNQTAPWWKREFKSEYVFQMTWDDPGLKDYLTKYHYLSEVCIVRVFVCVCVCVCVCV